VIKKNELDEACTHVAKKRNPYSILVGKPEKNWPLGRTMRRQEDNIRLDRREKGGKL
jgi:hypothetical protein